MYTCVSTIYILERSLNPIRGVTSTDTYVDCMLPGVQVITGLGFFLCSVDLG